MTTRCPMYAGLLLLCGLLSAPPALAATRRVPADHATLALALQAADDGDIIEVDATFTPDEPPVSVVLDVTVRGQGGAASLPALHVSGGAVVTLQDVVLGAGTQVDASVPCGPLSGGSAALCVVGATVAGSRVDAVGYPYGPAVYAAAGARVDLATCGFDANPHGALVLVGADAELQGCVFHANGDAAGQTQGVDIDLDGGTVWVRDSVFSGDSGAGDRGALRVRDGSLTIAESELGGYHAVFGAVVKAWSDQADTRVVLDRVTVIGAHATGAGGLAWLDDVDTTVIGTVLSNLSSDGPAGGFAVNGGSLELAAVTASGVWAAGDGGLVRATGGASITVDDTDVVGPTLRTAAGNGGAFALQDASLTWTGGLACDLAVLGAGGVIVAEDSDVALFDVVLDDTAAQYGGGIDQRGGTLSLQRVHASLLQAVIGGAVSAEEVSEVRIEDSTVRHGAASAGGAVHLVAPGDVAVLRSAFCANGTGQGGAALTIASPAGLVRIDNTRFQDNFAPSGATVRVSDGAGTLSARYNTFVGNVATTGAVRVERVGAGWWNNIVTGSETGLVRVGAAPFDGDYNLWFDNGVNVAGAPVPGNGSVQADPQLAGYAHLDCGSVLWLAPGSPARDAGDPAEADPDGSRADIGAYGGPLSPLPDADADGWYADLDCADDRAGVHPGASEIAYDGIDQDCDGSDLCDADGDGFAAWQCGGEDCDDGAAAVNPDGQEAWYDGVDQDCDGNDDDRDGDDFASVDAGGTDCDDDDPDVHPGAEERFDDDVDQDCDGRAQRAFLLGSGGCDATGGAGSTAVLLALLACLWRPRRRRR